MTTINTSLLVNIMPDVMPASQRPLASYVAAEIATPIPLGCVGATPHIRLDILMKWDDVSDPASYLKRFKIINGKTGAVLSDHVMGTLTLLELLGLIANDLNALGMLAVAQFTDYHWLQISNRVSSYLPLRIEVNLGNVGHIQQDALAGEALYNPTFALSPALTQEPSPYNDVTRATFCLAPYVPPVVDGPRIDEQYFNQDDVLITFDEISTHNPVYVVQSPTLGEVTVTTSSHFVGQNITTIGSEGASTVLGSQPVHDAPLMLASGDAFIVGDGANPTSPVLSGSPMFNGPIAVLFSSNVHAVALTGGYFNAIGATFIEAFDEMGYRVNLVSNSRGGIETFGIRTLNETANIRGISFYVNADEPAGFAIDNLRFK